MTAFSKCFSMAHLACSDATTQGNQAKVGHGFGVVSIAVCVDRVSVQWRLKLAHSKGPLRVGHLQTFGEPDRMPSKAAARRARSGCSFKCPHASSRAIFSGLKT